jgi:hypothetical protein
VLTQEVGSFVHDGLVEAFDAGDEVELLVPLFSLRARPTSFHKR